MKTSYQEAEYIGKEVFFIKKKNPKTSISKSIRGYVPG